MNPQISISKTKSENENNLTINVQVAASRNDALELLVFGTKAVMEALDITLMEYLEALMTARETDSVEKIMIDASIFSGNF